MSNKYKYIELFAGCGGMSLGLEAAGLELHFANEMSPMAGQTFAFNILGEDLENLPEGQYPENVLWLHSQHKRKEFLKRLRENLHDPASKVPGDAITKSNLKGKLLIGDIKELLNKLEEYPSLAKELQSLNIDLVSGGPPCQGFSLAGKRIKDDHKNALPAYFAQFVGIVRPKIVLLENVYGITTPFKVDGEKYYAWVEVAKAFAREGYIPVCMMLNSKYFGVPQNRPRFILLGLRDDVFIKYKEREDLDSKTLEVIANSEAFFIAVNSVNEKELYKITKKHITLRYIEDLKKGRPFFNGQLLPNIITPENEFRTAKDALHDLRSAGNTTSPIQVENDYLKELHKKFKDLNINKIKFLNNHELRKHSELVRNKFRLLQHFNKLNGHKNDAIDVFFKGDTNKSKIQAVYNNLLEHKVPFIPKEYIENLEKFKVYVKQFSTRKHLQRALIPNEPAPAQLTIPDDICHYDKKQPRTMSVREMARLQSFPDWFVFKSKITTGGISRSFEVPQYTQVGNAVPPLLAFYLGKTVINILNTVKNGE